MKKIICTTMAAGVAVLGTVATTVPAEAAASWSRTTTGASGWGSYTRSSQTYKISYTVYDTKSDGDCGYVVFRPQVQWASKVPGWLSVGYSGYEIRHNVCGSGKHISGSNTIDVRAHMSALDRQLANKMRLLIKVCRDVSLARDNCSEVTTTPVDI